MTWGIRHIFQQSPSHVVNIIDEENSYVFQYVVHINRKVRRLEICGQHHRITILEDPGSPFRSCWGVAMKHVMQS